MLTGEIVSVSHDGLNEECFSRSKIWCEYYLPDEIDRLVEYGEDREFLIRELIDFVESKNCEKTYYSLPDSWDHCLPEFSFVAAQFEIGALCRRGYVCFVQQEITAFSFFVGGTVEDLYLNSEFAEDNREVLDAISCDETVQNGGVSIKYALRASLPKLQQTERCLFFPTQRGEGSQVAHRRVTDTDKSDR